MARQPEVQYVSFYTAGSAARKVTPLVELDPVKKPKVKKKKKLLRIFVDPVSMLAVAMSALMLILMAVGVVQLNAARQNAQRMAAYVEQLQSQNQILADQFEDKLDLEDIERNALALGMIPAEQADTVILQIPEEPVEQTPDAWQGIYTFLTALFA